ncbi:hypothetical protein AWB76_06037 [Caballeronia temeraria]|uniref:Glycoside hydrolase family 5 domain-containing protein n=1 Tax=Caballeronia temeraria TaxID=1777137 RepID=A0A158CVD7_9BURK|nr:hypothetical protein [Caballeronia temeraria]SAK86315.1 hypothetical protein AWB76_06037 [Caballeronia temeraria]
MIRRRLALTFVALVSALFFHSSIAGEDNWYQFGIDLDRLSGPVDFSFLNHKIGEHDWIGTDRAHFVVFDERAKKATSRTIRFFGVSLGFDAAFPDATEGRQLADRLSRLGVNLVRLHQLDFVLRAKDESRIGGVLTTAPYPTLDVEAISRLKTFISVLRDHGIYVVLSIHCGYTFRDIDGVYVGGGQFPASRPLNEIFPKMIDLQQKFAESLISALGLGNDPTLAFVEINNEGSILNAWQKRKIDVNSNDAVGAELRARRKQLFDKNPAISDVDFLTALDRDYFDRIRGAVHRAAPRALIIGTQTDFGGLGNYTSDESADYRDTHFYVDHYDFPNGLWNKYDWRQRNTSLIGSGLSELLRVAVLRDVRKPFMVSEFNEPWPNTHGSEILPVTASFACFQDWGGLAFYDYAHRAFAQESNTPHEFSLSGDLSKLAVFGISAAIFRQSLVDQGGQLIAIPLPASTRAAATTARANGNVLAFLEQRGELKKRSILVHKIGVDPYAQDAVRVPNAIDASSTLNPVAADNGQVSYSLNRLYVIDAPRIVGYIGYLPAGNAVSTKFTSLTSLSRDEIFSSILALSLDSRPISESKHILLAVSAATARSAADGRSALSLQAYQGESDWWTVKSQANPKPSDMLTEGSGSVWMQRTPFFFHLRGAFRAADIYALDGAGRRFEKLPSGMIQMVPDGMKFGIQTDVSIKSSPWYEIVIHE